MSGPQLRLGKGWDGSALPSWRTLFDMWGSESWDEDKNGNVHTVLSNVWTKVEVVVIFILHW